VALWGLTTLFLAACHMTGCDDDSFEPTGEAGDRTPAGDTLITYVDSPGLGPIAVRLELPDVPRYDEGAPVVVHASTFFAGALGFHRVFDTRLIGAIAVAYLRPGSWEPASGIESAGETDYGGPNHLAALRDVIRFASGLTPNTDGRYIGELLAITPLIDNVGMFASSHSGIVATNVIAHHGAEIPSLKYLVGRENPTRDEMYPLELGHFDESRNQIENPFYDAGAYTPTTISIDYSQIGWVTDAIQPLGRPDFLDEHGAPLGYLHPTIRPFMWNRRFYSRGLTQALLDNAALALESWPEDLATPQMTQDVWPFRITVFSYPLIGSKRSDLKVMLAFAEKDHVQAAPDKPHIRQAYDGFRKSAGLSWVRLNPDAAYAGAIDAAHAGAMPEHPANSEPTDWNDAEAWGFPGVTPDTKYLVPVAGVAEMADRVRAEDWSLDLEAVLHEYSR
jgi:hypothetical protein